MPRVTVPLRDETWRGLRRLAEERRDQGGRANIASLMRELVEKELESTAVAAKVDSRKA